MKELSIEEKARAYDEALERMKSWVRGDHPECFTEAQKTAEFIFPELKESEDERIKNKLIKLIKMSSEVGGFALHKWEADEMVTWIEKQGKEEYALKSFKDEDVRKFMQYIEKEAKVYDFNLPHRGYDIYAFAKDILVWLEKQGEKHKPSIREKYKCIANSEWFKKIHEGMSVSDDEKVNKVEPKFHEGDWIIYNNDICQIVKREEGCNKLVTVFGIEKELVNERNLSTARLWTIQDAKDGDVLLSKHNQPFIYNGIFDEESVGAYCGIDKFGNDFLKDVFSCDWCYKEGVKPATKEQRELLFTKMKDAGYEFNFEKKELKKFHIIDEGKDEMDYCFTKMMNGEKVSSTWSEEDEKMVKDIIAAIDTLYYHGMVNWLKLIKDRVQPQLQPTWSEEDEKMVNRLIGVLVGTNKEDYHEGWEDIFLPWLKSLKDRVQPQNRWKPSKEQIIALRWVLNNIPYNKHKEEISGLLDQIKDL